MTQNTEYWQDRLESAVNELAEIKECFSSLREERDTLLSVLSALVAEVHNKCPGVALPTLLSARETLLKIS